MRIRFLSIVLTLLVGVGLLGSGTPAQAGLFVERINSWDVIRIEDYVNCQFPFNTQSMFVYQTITATWTAYSEAPPDSILVVAYDPLGNEIGRPRSSILDPTGQGGGIGSVTFGVMINGEAPTPHPRPWRMVAIDDRGDGEVLGSIIVDPADFGVCTDAPYIEIATGTESTPIIDTTSQDTAIYNSLDDDGNPSLDVYGINDEGEGYYQFTVTQDDLAPFIDNPPEENTEIDSVDGVVLSVLDTGEFQLNIGPDDEGKVRVVIFDGLPPTNVYTYDYNINDILYPDTN